MTIFSKTDIGLKRSENQDCVWGEMLSEQACSAVLCDGMGGEAHGELASRMTVDIVSKRIKENFSDNMTQNFVRNLLITSVCAANFSVTEEAARQIAAANQAGNSYYAEKSQQSDGLHQVGVIMGTTCVAAVVIDNTAHIVNVGDSRCYHLFPYEDSDCIQQVTRDHSHVQDLVERGSITAEQARTHPDRSKITRAVGAESTVTPDYFEVKLSAGDMLLLCSDGLSSYVDDMEILDICCENTADNICQALINRANASGGHDNVSVALISV